MYTEYLGKIAEILDAGLKTTDPGVKAKYEWLLARYEEDISLLVSEPEGSPFRRSNPELYEDLMGLPRFKS